MARELLDEALDWFERADNKRGMAEAMMGFAALHAAKGEHARAARLIGAGDRALEEIDAGLWPADERERERDLSAIRAGLGDDATDLELRAGRELALADAVAIARTETP